MAEVNSFNLTNGVIGSSFIADKTSITSLYGLTIDPYTNYVYVSDALSYNGDTGTAYAFGTDGKMKFNFPTAGNPTRAVFIYNYKK